MTTLGSYSYLGGYGPIASVTAPADPAEKATEQDALSRDSVAYAYPQIGFGKAPPPSDDLWWAMRRYSACVLAYAVTAGPVFAGTRSATIRDADGDVRAPVRTGLGVQVTESPEEKRRKLTEDVFEDQWPDILEGLESYNFGRWLSEVIWGRAYGVTAPVRFKSFLPWQVQLLRDKYNDFAGFQVKGSTDDGRRGAPYAFLSVAQPQFDPIFGVPRAENARESWWRAVQCHENGDRIERKASGIQMYLSLPTGVSWKDKDGNAVLTRTATQTIVNAAASGALFTVPSFWTKDDIKNKPELAGIDPVKIKEFDWGNTGQSLLASISRLDRLDKEIFRAWHRPEREAMEGEHGTKAEAGVHGQVGIIDSEKVHGDFLRQFNKQVVDRFLVTNFGPEAAGTIYFKPTPLVDAQQAFKQEIVKAMLSSPTEGPALAAEVMKRDLLKQTEVPMVPEGTAVVTPAMPEEEPDDEPLADAA